MICLKKISESFEAEIAWMKWSLNDEKRLISRYLYVLTNPYKHDKVNS